MRPKSVFRIFGLMLALISIGSVSAQRRMTVTHGPESVFDVSVVQVLPELTGARRTGENGRVGNEFVFWGYRFDDGNAVWLYACALVDDVDCPERRNAVCAAGIEVLAEREYMGNAVHRRCLDVGIAAAGELHPGCSDSSYVAPLSVGVLACRTD